jgi:plastocyanin
MTPIRRVAGCALAAVTLVVAGCGSDSKDATPTTVATTAAPAPTTVPPTTQAPTTVAPTTTTEKAGPQTVQVGIDGTNDDFNATYFNYFPAKVTVHPGDTVRYKSAFRGEPHSITFGTDITALIDLFQSQPPEVQSGQSPPPDDVNTQFNDLSAKIPVMLPDGPGDANQNAVNPCFVQTGAIPTDTTKACPITSAPGPFDGTATFWNSGFLPDAATFDLQLSPDIKPGKYVGFCVLHQVAMISEIDVVAADEDVPSPDAVLAAGKQELNDLTTKASSAVTAALAANTPGQVQAGVGGPDAPTVLATEFAPRDSTIKAGESVTWTINGPHTVSFNPPESARTIVTQSPDGAFHLVPDAFAPAGYAPPPPSDDPNAPPPAYDAGTWNGTGFLNSGFMTAGTFKVTFSTAGTYAYVCLIHPDMKGTVTVT